MRLRQRPLPLAGFCSIAAAIGAAAILTGAAFAAAAAPAAWAAGNPGSAAGSAGRAQQAAMTRGMLTGDVRGPGGAGLARVCVVASGRMGTRAAVSASDGRYVITGLRPGSYAIGFHDCGAAGRFLTEWYGGSVLPDAAAHVQVSAGAPVALDPVTMKPVGGMRAVDRAAAQRAASRAAGSPAASGQSISGVVRNAAGKALAGVCVAVFNNRANGLTGEGTETGRGGRYSFGVSRGKWMVSFGNGCGGNYAPQWWKHVGSQPKATSLNVRRGSHFTGIDAKLVAGGAITGTVRGGSKSGPGVGGVCVLAEGRGSAAGIEQQAQTHKDGSYRITGLGTGRYQIQFDPECGAGGKYLGRTFNRQVGVTASKTTRNITTFLVRAAEISGTVTAANGGAPLAGICTFAQPELTGQELLTAGAFGVPTGPQGGYTVTGLPAGKYTMSFSGGCGNKGSYAPQSYNDHAVPSAANTVTLTTGQHATGINAAMRPGGTITGTVTNQAGAALRGMCAFATSAPDAGGFGNGVDGLLLSVETPFSDGAATGRTGRYRIANLVPGSYEVSFSSGCAFKLGPVVYASQWFAPQGGDMPDWLAVRPGVVTAGIGASLRSGASIAGIIKSPAGTPAKGICASAFPLSGQPPEVMLVAGGAGSAKDGRYQIRGLATGKYSVVFVPCFGQPYALSWYKGATSSASAKPVSVTDGHVTGGINATMSGGRTVAGMVRSGASGSPVRSVCVVAVDSGGLAVEFEATGSKGRFAFAHVASGRYTLEFFPCGAAATNLANVTKVIQVAGAAVTGASVTLPLAGAVSGTVTGGTAAAPIAGVCVEATPKTGRGAPGLAVTDGQGQYTMTGLAAGSYTILFAPDCAAGLGGFRPQWFNGEQNEAQATPVGVGPGGTHAGIDATLTADGGITGTVQASSSPVGGVCVVAYPVSGTQRPALAETAANGQYTISELAPGSYDVEFKAGCGRSTYTTQWYNGVASKGAATPVVVTAGTVAQAIDAN